MDRPRASRYRAAMSSTLPDHYAALGLARSCTGEEIRTAYRLLARQHHPDVNQQSAEAIARTQVLNAAYAVLNDPEQRRDYDRDLAAVEGTTRRPLRSTATNLTAEVRLGAEGFLRGASLTVRVHDPSLASGPETYALEVPPGTAPGARLRVPRTAPGAVGFVIARVKFRPDARFKARGSDLRCDLRISNQRAEQGGVESVRGATGQSLRVAIPRRVPRHEIIRLPGEGLPRPRGGRGDLLVRIVYRPEVRILRNG